MSEIENAKTTSENEIKVDPNLKKEKKEKKKQTIKNIFKKFGSSSNDEKAFPFSFKSLKKNKFLNILVIIVLVGLGVYVLYLKKMKKEKGEIDEKNPFKLFKKKINQSNQPNQNKKVFFDGKKKSVRFNQDKVKQKSKKISREEQGEINPASFESEKRFPVSSESFDVPSDSYEEHDEENNENNEREEQEDEVPFSTPIA